MAQAAAHGAGCEKTGVVCPVFTVLRRVLHSCSSQSTNIRAARKHRTPTVTARGVKQEEGIPARIPMGEDRTSPRTEQYVMRANLENKVSISRAKR